MRTRRARSGQADTSKESARFATGLVCQGHVRRFLTLITERSRARLSVASVESEPGRHDDDRSVGTAPATTPVHRAAAGLPDHTELKAVGNDAAQTRTD